MRTQQKQRTKKDENEIENSKVDELKSCAEKSNRIEQMNTV